jgi:hypothetical protein
MQSPSKRKAKEAKERCQEPKKSDLVPDTFSLLSLLLFLTLSSRILGAYGDKKEVDDHFFMAYMSGAWHGEASHHWEHLANELSGVASRTKLSKLKRWARDAAQHFRGMAERDREKELEEELRRR